MVTLETGSVLFINMKNHANIERDLKVGPAYTIIRWNKIPSTLN